MKFTDFVNSYRIQYVLDEINKGKLMTQTQISIAEEAGFSGKQSFYNAFRKAYQCTPTEFLKKQTAWGMIFWTWTQYFYPPQQ